MILKIITCVLLSLPGYLLSNQSMPHNISENEEPSTPSTLRGADNKLFDNVHVYHTLDTHDLFTENNLIIGKNLKVNGPITGGIGTLHGPDAATKNAAARFTDVSGNTITDSPILIDDSGTITGVDTITADTVNAYLNGTATNALFVGGQSAANIVAATILLTTATNNAIPETFIKRDSTGAFTTNMITLTGRIINTTDAATKDYVDTFTASAFLPKAPAFAASNSSISPLNGAPVTIDGLSVAATNTILLLGQTDPIENGLWIVQEGNWTRPADFVSPPEVGRAYIFVQNGTTLGGTSWLCTTPDAIIDTNPLNFIEYSLSGYITGNNVGNGTGTLFKDTTGNYILFKSLVGDDQITITDNLIPDNSDCIITLTGYSENSFNTLVLRDSSNTFSATTITAQLTGTASANILRSGDTMTGTLTLPAGSPVNPSLQLYGSDHTGLSAVTNKLILSTDATEKMSITETGTIIINQYAGSPGIIHANNFGELSQSLVVNADIDVMANIADSKLATINTPGKILDSATTATSEPLAHTIVKRDEQGNFSADTITVNTIIGSLSNYIVRSGDTMTSTFTVIAGSEAHPSVAFANSINTGLSAEVENTLVLSTHGHERMSINETGTLTLYEPLILSTSPATHPSLQFLNGSQTGLSSATKNTISFDRNGIERLRIDTSSITVTDAAFVIDTVMSLISTQSLHITTYGTHPLTINNDTSLVIIRYLSGGPTTVALSLPSNPHEGQLLTIKAILELIPPDTSNNLNLTYDYTFDPTTEEVTLLNPTLALNAEFYPPNRGTGGASVTYIYQTTASGYPHNGWYRYSRG